jgi:hypothetical protein
MARAFGYVQLAVTRKVGASAGATTCWYAQSLGGHGTMSGSHVRTAHTASLVSYCAQRQLLPNNLVKRTQIPLRGLCAAYLGR